jgi:hypothetical protein
MNREARAVPVLRSASGTSRIEEFREKISREKTLSEKEQAYYKAIKAAEKLCPESHQTTLSDLKIDYEYRIAQNLEFFFGELNSATGVS